MDEGDLMASNDKVNKVMRGCVAAFALAAGGTSVAQAQNYDENYYQSHMVSADLRSVDAEYQSELASCRSRQFSDYSRGYGGSIEGTAQSRVCRAEAEVDRLEDTASVYRRHNMTSQYYQFLQASFQARAVAIKAQHDYRVTECNVEMAEDLRRSRKWTDRAEVMADAQSCSASAERNYYSDMSRLQRDQAAAQSNYRSDMQRRR